MKKKKLLKALKAVFFFFLQPHKFTKPQRTGHKWRMIKKENIW